MSNQSSSLSLIVQIGPNPGQVFAVKSRSQTIGRAPDNDIFIPDESLSPQHARLTPTVSGVVLEDLGSENGTFLNGERVQRPTLLHADDTVQLADKVTLSVQLSQLELDHVATIASATAPLRQDRPPPPSTLPSQISQPSYPPPKERSPLLAIGIGAGVTVLFLGILLGGLYYLNLIPILLPGQTVPTPEGELSQIQPISTYTLTPTRTSTPKPTATATPTPLPSPTPEMIVDVPGIPAAAAEKLQPPEDNSKEIDPFCNGDIEVKANQAIRVSWQKSLAEAGDTDYQAEWLESASYDIRLDDVPITELGPLYYYRSEFCDADHCGPTLHWWTNVGLLDVGSYRLAIKSYTSRAISDGFDRQPVDGTPDIYGPGQIGSGFCNIVVVEVPTPTPPPTFTVTPTPIPTPTFTPPPAFGPGVFQDFEDASPWKRGNQPYGEFSQSTVQVYRGSYAGQLSYNFPEVEEDFVDFQQPRSLAGQPTVITAWVYGDNSGNFLNVWIRDAQGERWAMSFGQIQHSGWQQMTARLNENRDWPSGHIDGPSNGRIDYPISFNALVLDNIPNTSGGQGTIYIDDLESQ